MAKKYLIWKNANPNDWLQITGPEFYALVNSKEGQGRHFIHLASGSDPNTEPDDIYMEASAERYKKHREKQNHTDYLNRFAQNISVISLDQPIRTNANEEKSLHEILSGDAECTDEKAINNILAENLRKAVQGLPEKERQLVDAVFTRQVSQAQAAAELGITQQMISKLQKKILKKLKLLVVEIEKSQQ